MRTFTNIHLPNCVSKCRPHILLLLINIAVTIIIIIIINIITRSLTLPRMPSLHISHFYTSSFPSGLLCPQATLSMSIAHTQLFEKLAQSKNSSAFLSHINLCTHLVTCITHIKIRVDRSVLDFCECFLWVSFGFMAKPSRKTNRKFDKKNNNHTQKSRVLFRIPRHEKCWKSKTKVKKVLLTKL